MNDPRAIAFQFLPNEPIRPGDDRLEIASPPRFARGLIVKLFEARTPRLPDFALIDANNALPARFMIYAFLVAGLMVANLAGGRGATTGWKACPTIKVCPSTAP